MSGGKPSAATFAEITNNLNNTDLSIAMSALRSVIDYLAGLSHLEAGERKTVDEAKVALNSVFRKVKAATPMGLIDKEKEYVEKVNSVFRKLRSATPRLLA